jgi:hypothetical protein
LTDRRFKRGRSANDKNIETRKDNMAKTTGKTTLLIWEEVPENTKLYLIPNEIVEKYKEHLDQAHGHMINEEGWDENPGLKVLSAALMGDDEGEVDEGFEEFRGVFTEYLAHDTSAGEPIKPLTDVNVTAIYFSGFMM